MTDKNESTKPESAANVDASALSNLVRRDANVFEANPTVDEACHMAAEGEGHDRYAADECQEGGEQLDCNQCPYA